MIKVLITLIAVTVLTGNMAAEAQTDYQQLENKIRKLEVLAYQGSMTNANALEMLCRETHSASFCTEMYRKAMKGAQERAQQYAKEVFGRPSNVSASTPPRVIITDKWKDRSLWRRQLKRNMTQDQVLSIFGEPDKVSVFGANSRKWHYGYPGGGSISFYGKGVNSWSEP